MTTKQLLFLFDKQNKNFVFSNCCFIMTIKYIFSAHIIYFSRRSALTHILNKTKVEKYDRHRQPFDQIHFDLFNARLVSLLEAKTKLLHKLLRNTLHSISPKRKTSKNENTDTLCSKKSTNSICRRGFCLH